MKRLFFIFPLVLFVQLVYAQGNQGGRDPAGAGRSPAGEKSGREGGGKQGGSDAGGKSDKPGKNSVSKGAKEHASEIKAINSKDGKGGNMTANQQREVNRQMNDAKINAAKEGRTADVKFFEGQKKKN